MTDVGLLAMCFCKYSSDLIAVVDLCCVSCATNSGTPLQLVSALNYLT